MDKEFLSQLLKEHKDAASCPTPYRVSTWFNQLLGLLFPEFATENISSLDTLERDVDSAKNELFDLVVKAGKTKNEAQEIGSYFFKKLPEIKQWLQQDIEAMYLGDPAANSKTEVVRTYPGFYAISAYRFAHLLASKQVALIPRMITEIAHSRTGIDIHPAAKIGNHFCIDHGTGIVIGETSEIGNHVKIYQGVTLGALSVAKEDASSKRHPTIENGVVIYAGATILGGKTIIGENSIIGGNVWITQSIPKNTKVYYVLKARQGEKETELIIQKEIS